MIQQLQQLTPATRPKWGKFNAARMQCHLNDALAISLGDVPSHSVNRKDFNTSP
jgi:hypothetical protein